MQTVENDKQPKNEPEPSKDPEPEPKKDPEPEPQPKDDPGADYLNELDAKANEGKPADPPHSDSDEALTRAERRAELAEARLKAVSDAYVELRRSGVEVKPKAPAPSPEAISIEELVAATRGHRTPDIIR